MVNWVFAAGAAVALLLVGAVAYLFALWRKSENRHSESVALQTAKETTLQTKLEATEQRKDELESEVAKYRGEAEQQQTTLTQQGNQIVKLEQQLDNERSNAAEKATSLENITQQLQEKQNTLTQQGEEIATLRQQLDNERANATEKLELLEKAKKQMEAEFKNLAQEILEQKSKQFGEDSQKRLNPLLSPLQEQVKQFSERMEAMQADNVKERTTLQNQIENLKTNALKISEDAHNLTTALKGDRKMQGNWGEMLLEKLLESSGLVRDEHYTVQEAGQGEDGNRLISDVIVKLPDDKHLVIDSKISLSAYVEYNESDDEEIQAAALQRHVRATRQHIDTLSKKNYSGQKDIHSPDFVLMFMGIEPAYMLALRKDADLIQYAYNKTVMLVSPTTLMPILRTVSYLWQMDKQQRNANNIAEQGGKLLDKLNGFLDDMDDLGKSLQRAQDKFTDANKKLSVGRGNLIGQANKLQDMGAKGKKPLPPALDSLE